ncbi:MULTISPECIES: thermonuclease family protein [Helicobacter]|uniref:Thermonuclease family protein n=1 Tax=Helicobacter ibis TaxID=2962633 RepID=A0ABT4VC65_9HELI|nr:MULTISPECIES: thermonuclease family protein [Helicobacter]MDA3967545.1 thermonuclease family protein [Helicobacter sp. WB40]MDA3968293.1 thermonuclease family protein [Helicobacter ibis]
MSRIFFVFLLVLNLYAYTIPPVTTSVILKYIYAPTLFSVYAKDYGMLYCQLYGIAMVSQSFKSENCEVSPRAVKEMRHFALTYTQNTIFLEQQYRIGYKNGWCFLQNGGKFFNAQLVENGYAVVQYFDISEPKIIEDLEVLENIAKTNKRGLWREWEQEMECLKSALRGIAREMIEE